MNTHRVKFFTIIFVSLLAWSLPACSDDDNKTGNGGTTDVIEAPDATGDDATEGDATEGDATEGDATEGDATEGDATEGDATEGDATEGDATEDDATGGMTGCDYEGFTAVEEDAIPYFGMMYLAQSTLGAPVDTLKLDLGGVDGPTTLQFDGTSYADCENCLTIWMGCDEDLNDCQKIFLASEGTLTIDSFGDSGELFSGSITNGRLIEVTLENGLESTPVADGETWCLPNYEFSVTVQ